MRAVALFLLLLPVLCGCSKPERLVIYATPGARGVFWSRHEGGKQLGGLGAFANLVSGETAPRLVLGGDGWFLGAKSDARDRGLASAKLMKESGFDAVLAGPDEFVFGLQNLQYIAQVSSLPIVGYSMHGDGRRKMLFERQGVVRDYGGFKAGVVGLSGVAKGASQSSELELAREYALKLRRAGAGIVVAVLSCGWQEQPQRIRQRASELAAAVPELSLIVAFSRTQTELDVFRAAQSWVAVCPPSQENALRLELALAPATNAVMDVKAGQILLDAAVLGQAPAIAAAAAELRGESGGQMGRRVTSAEDDIELGEPMGNLTADCLLRWGKGHAALLNRASVRSSIGRGVVTERQLYEVYPQNDTVMIVKIRGADLQQAIEHNLEKATGLPYVSGLSISYDPAGPEGGKIRAITVDGAPLSDSKIYKVLSTDYMLAGGENWGGLSQAVEFANTNEPVRKILRWCLAKQHSIRAPRDSRWVAD